MTSVPPTPATGLQHSRGGGVLLHLDEGWAWRCGKKKKKEHTLPLACHKFLCTPIPLNQVVQHAKEVSQKLLPPITRVAKRFKDELPFGHPKSNERADCLGWPRHPVEEPVAAAGHNPRGGAGHAAEGPWRARVPGQAGGPRQPVQPLDGRAAGAQGADPGLPRLPAGRQGRGHVIVNIVITGHHYAVAHHLNQGRKQGS